MAGTVSPIKTTDLLGAMKERYIEDLIELSNRETILLDTIEADTQIRWTGEGKYAVLFIHAEGGLRGQGAYVEGGNLLLPDKQVVDQGKVYWKSLAYTIGLTGQAIAAVKKGDGSVIDAKVFENMQNAKWLREKMTRMMYGNGFGDLGTVSAIAVAAGDTTLTMDAATNMNWFRKGMRVDGWAPGLLPANRRAGVGGVNDQTTEDIGWTISAVNKAAKTLLFTAQDLSAVDSTIAGDILRPENIGLGAVGATGNYGSGVELTGLRALVSDGNVLSTVEGFTLATYPQFKGLRDTSGIDRDLTVDLLQTVEDNISVESNSEPTDTIIPFDQRRKLIALGLQDVRHASEELKLGFKKLTFNGREFTVDRMMLPGKVFMGSIKKSFARAVLQALGPLDKNPGGVRPSRQYAFEWIFGTDQNLIVRTPNANAWIENLKQT